MAAIERISLTSALQKVEGLLDLPLPDEQQCIEARSFCIQHQTSFDTNFEDRLGYATGVARYMEEATVQSNLVGSFRRQ